MLEIIAYEESDNERILSLRDDGNTYLILWDDVSNESAMNYIRNLGKNHNCCVKDDEVQIICDMIEKRHGTGFYFSDY